MTDSFPFVVVFDRGNDGCFHRSGRGSFKPRDQARARLKQRCLVGYGSREAVVAYSPARRSNADARTNTIDDFAELAPLGLSSGAERRIRHSCMFSAVLSPAARCRRAAITICGRAGACLAGTLPTDRNDRGETEFTRSVLPARRRGGERSLHSTLAGSACSAISSDSEERREVPRMSAGLN